MYKYVGGKSKQILSLWYTVSDWDNLGFYTMGQFN